MNELVDCDDAFDASVSEGEPLFEESIIIAPGLLHEARKVVSQKSVLEACTVVTPESSQLGDQSPKRKRANSLAKQTRGNVSTCALRCQTIIWVEDNE